MVLCPNLSVIRLNDRASDGQSKSSALLFGRVKRLENVSELVLGDARTGIAYRYFDRQFSHEPRSNRNLTRAYSTIRHRIHCVRHKVQYYLLQMDWIGSHEQSPRDAVYAQINVAPVGFGRK